MQAAGIQLRWMDEPGVVGELTEPDTADRWIYYRNTPRTARSAVVRLTRLLTTRFKAGQTLLVCGPFFYDRDVRPFWLCEFGRLAL